MKKSKVCFYKIKKQTKSEVQGTVKKAMRKANWKKYVKGKKIFVKINGISDQLVPGQNTSPWVVEAVLQELTRTYPKTEFSMGDADLAAATQLERSAKLWGFKDLAKKYGVRFVNLSKDDTVDSKINGEIFKTMPIPKSLVEADSIITLPIMKAHCLTTITCALKNQWGCLPRVRHQYHPVAHQAIAEINSFLKIKFALVDGTISMEHNAPRTGIPKICDVIFAGNDRVAVDSAVATYMGFNPMKIKHLEWAEKYKVGTRNFEIVGDRLEINPFIVPEPDKQPIFFLETKLRKTKIKPLIFDTKLFSIFAWGATQYNTKLWYYTKGKKYREEIFKNSNYDKEFLPLMKRK